MLKKILKRNCSELGIIQKKHYSIIKNELYIESVLDWLEFYPIRYSNKSEIKKISSINSLNKEYLFKGYFSSFQIFETKNKKQFLKAKFSDNSGIIDIYWFRGYKYITKSIDINKEYYIFSKIQLYNNNYVFYHPEIKKIDSFKSSNLSLKPIFKSTEFIKKVGINNKVIEGYINNMLNYSEKYIYEIFSEKDIKKYNLPNRKDSFKNIFFPKNYEQLEEAKYRLKFEELFFSQLKVIARYKKNVRDKNKGLLLKNKKENLCYKLTNKLDFKLTDDQKKVIDEIFLDLKSGKHMNRLLQGDVGSGKTIVAIFSILKIIEYGYQSVFIAPTEILSNQHYFSLKQILKDIDVNIELLTGSTKKSEKLKIYEKTKKGNIDILIGTHSILQDELCFKNLGLAVIDEQHRFGVVQRSKVWKKNNPSPHVLLMTATPIPRTLSMTIYNDLKTSIIKQFPAGRKKIETIHRYQKSNKYIYEFIYKEIKKGRQAYIVYPLIEESEKLPYDDLINGFEEIKNYFYNKNINIDIVHGRQKIFERNDVMNNFLNNKIQILVSTTVIEVGLNVPNATVMLIMNSEKFGLSQLHQLRGRVGRSSNKSYCILSTSYKLTKNAKERIKTMVNYSDGFKISEIDLKLRGPGDIDGAKQSGILNFKIANIFEDKAIIEKTKELCHQIVNLKEEEKKVYYKNLIDWYKLINNNKLSEIS